MTSSAEPLATHSETPGGEPSNWDFALSAVVVWGAFWTIAIGISVVVLVRKMAAGDHTPPTTEEMMTPAVIAISTLSDFGVTLLATWIFAARRHARRFVDALAIRRVPARTLALAIGIGLVTPIGSLVLPHGEVSPLEKLAQTTGGLVAITLLALASPFVEEIWYRGMFLPVFRRWIGVVPAIAVVSIWFGALHAFQLKGDPSAVFYILGLGLIWTVQRHVTGSLVPSIVSHFLHNFGVVLMTWISFATAGE